MLSELSLVENDLPAMTYMFHTSPISYYSLQPPWPPCCSQNFCAFLCASTILQSVQVWTTPSLSSGLYSKVNSGRPFLTTLFQIPSHSQYHSPFSFFLPSTQYCTATYYTGNLFICLSQQIVCSMRTGNIFDCLSHYCIPSPYDANRENTPFSY